MTTDRRASPVHNGKVTRLAALIGHRSIRCNSSGSQNSDQTAKLGTADLDQESVNALLKVLHVMYHFSATYLDWLHSDAFRPVRSRLVMTGYKIVKQ